MEEQKQSQNKSEEETKRIHKIIIETAAVTLLVALVAGVAMALVGSNQSGLTSNTLTLVASVLAVYAMLKVNWDRLGDRLVGEEGDTQNGAPRA